MSKKRSVYKNDKDGRTGLRDNLGSPFCPRPVEFLASPAFRVLTKNDHLVLARIEIELRSHGGHDNGKLPVTKFDFIDYGVYKHSISDSIRVLEALGIITVQHGRGGNSEHRQPNRFGLNFLCGQLRDAALTNSWKRFKSIEEAENTAAKARAAKDPTRVSYGRRSAAKAAGQKTFPGPANPIFRPRLPGLKTKIPGPGYQGSVPDPVSRATIDISGSPRLGGPSFEEGAEAPPTVAAQCRAPGEQP